MLKQFPKYKFVTIYPHAFLTPQVGNLSNKTKNLGRYNLLQLWIHLILPGSSDQMANNHYRWYGYIREQATTYYSWRDNEQSEVDICQHNYLVFSSWIYWLIQVTDWNKPERQHNSLASALHATSLLINTIQILTKKEFHNFISIATIYIGPSTGTSWFLSWSCQSLVNMIYMYITYLLLPSVMLYSETCLKRPMPWETTCLNRPCIFVRRTYISI